MEPFWPPKSGQDRPKTRLEATFFQKGRFSRNIGRRSVWSTSRSPRRPLRRAKIAPRRPQDDLQEHLFLTSFLSSIWGRLGSHFGSILAPLWAPKWRQSRGIVGAWINKIDPWRPMTVQDRPRPPQEPPGCVQDNPARGPQTLFFIDFLSFFEFWQFRFI